MPRRECASRLSTRLAAVSLNYHTCFGLLVSTAVEWLVALVGLHLQLHLHVLVKNKDLHYNNIIS